VIPKSKKIEKRLAGLAAFLPEFEREGFVFGQWEGGAMQMPYYSLSEAGMAFYKAVYALGWVVDFDWPEWGRTPEGERLLGDPAVLAEASVEDLARVITTCIRRDRFCEGALAGDFKEGRLLAILRRAAALLTELRADSAKAADLPPGR
jgi:hypothetical protein